MGRISGAHTIEETIAQSPEVGHAKSRVVSFFQKRVHEPEKNEVLSIFNRAHYLFNDHVAGKFRQAAKASAKAVVSGIDADDTLKELKNPELGNPSLATILATKGLVELDQTTPLSAESRAAILRKFREEFDSLVGWATRSARQMQSTRLLEAML